MLKTLATLTVSLAVGGSAFAAGKVPAPKCENFAKFKANIAQDPDLKNAKLTVLTDGQWHLVEGIYAGSPLTPPGAPPGNGAVLIQMNKTNNIIWLRGKDACTTVMAMGGGRSGEPPRMVYRPMPLTDDQVKLLEVVKTGVSETAPSTDDSQDLHL